MQTSHARETDLGLVIYDQDGLEMAVPAWPSGNDVPPYPRPEHWCSDEWRTRFRGATKDSYQVYVRYDVPHGERLRRFGSDYEEFVRTKVHPALIELCGPIDVSEITLNMGRKGESGWDTLVLAVAQGGQSITRTDYYPSALARASMTMAEIEAMLPKAPAGKAPAARGEQLYADGKVAIYARQAVWCYAAVSPPPGSGIDVIVPVAYDELRNWLGQNYGNFTQRVIKPLLEKHGCNLGAPNTAYFYEGEAATEYLESVRYGLQQSSPFAPYRFAALSHDQGHARSTRLAAVEAEKRQQDAWGLPCKGYFCALPGGAYFQAILANDPAAIKKMDAMVDQRLQARIPGGAGARARPAYSLLPAIANTYFFSYQDDFMLSCADNLVSKRYTHTHGTYEMPDYQGFAMPDFTARTNSASYVLLPEFVQLCDRVCDALGGEADRMVVNALNHDAAQQTISGVYKISDLYTCSEPAIKLFERHLIGLTEAYLRDRSGWLDE